MRKRRKRFNNNSTLNDMVNKEDMTNLNEFVVHNDDTDLNDLNEMAIEEEKDNMNATSEFSFGQIFLDEVSNQEEVVKDVIVSTFPKIDKFGSVVPRT